MNLHAGMVPQTRGGEGEGGRGSGRRWVGCEEEEGDRQRGGRCESTQGIRARANRRRARHAKWSRSAPTRHWDPGVSICNGSGSACTSGFACPGARLVARQQRRYTCRDRVQVAAPPAARCGSCERASGLPCFPPQIPSSFHCIRERAQPGFPSGGHRLSHTLCAAVQQLFRQLEARGSRFRGWHRFSLTIILRLSGTNKKGQKDGAWRQPAFLIRISVTAKCTFITHSGNHRVAQQPPKNARR